ncbi:M23 family metallopeptidase, partial [Desulfobacter latus]
MHKKTVYLFCSALISIFFLFANFLYASDYYGVSIDNIADTVEKAAAHDDYSETEFHDIIDSEGWLDDAYITKELLETKVNYYSTHDDGLNVTIGDLLLPLYVRYKIALEFYYGKNLLEVFSDQNIINAWSHVIERSEEMEALANMMIVLKEYTESAKSKSDFYNCIGAIDLIKDGVPSLKEFGEYLTGELLNGTHAGDLFSLYGFLTGPTILSAPSAVNAIIDLTISAMDSVLGYTDLRQAYLFFYIGHTLFNNGFSQTWPNSANNDLLDMMAKAASGNFDSIYNRCNRWHTRPYDIGYPYKGGYVIDNDLGGFSEIPLEPFSEDTFYEEWGKILFHDSVNDSIVQEHTEKAKNYLMFLESVFRDFYENEDSFHISLENALSEIKVPDVRNESFLGSSMCEQTGYLDYRPFPEIDSDSLGKWKDAMGKIAHHYARQISHMFMGKKASFNFNGNAYWIGRGLGVSFINDSKGLTIALTNLKSKFDEDYTAPISDSDSASAMMLGFNGGWRQHFPEFDLIVRPDLNVVKLDRWLGYIRNFYNAESADNPEKKNSDLLGFPINDAQTATDNTGDTYAYQYFDKGVVFAKKLPMLSWAAPGMQIFKPVINGLPDGDTVLQGPYQLSVSLTPPEVNMALDGNLLFGDITYKWTLNDEVVSNSSNIDIELPAGTNDLIIEMISSLGSRWVRRYKFDVSNDANLMPANLQIDIQPASPAIGDQVTLTASADDPSGTGLSYVWTHPDGSKVTSTTTTYTQPDQAYQVQLEVSNYHGTLIRSTTTGAANGGIAGVDIIGPNAIREKENAYYSIEVTYVNGTIEKIAPMGNWSYDWLYNDSINIYLAADGRLWVPEVPQETRVNLTFEYENETFCRSVFVKKTSAAISETELNTVVPCNSEASTNFPSYNISDNATDNQKIACYLFNKQYGELDGENGVFYNYNNWGDNPEDYGGIGHSGIDMQTKNVAGGNPDNYLEPFYAVTSGKVFAAENNSTYNRVVVYDAVKNISVIYLHAYQTEVSVGDYVAVGDRLGIQGAQGTNDAWHVHVEVRPGQTTYASYTKDGTLNPIPYILSYLEDVTISEETEQIVSFVEISGPRTVDEYGTAQYQFALLYEDGSSEVVSAADWQVDDSSSASINSSGLLSASGVDYSTSINLTADYQGYTATRTVVISDQGTYVPPSTTLALASYTATCGIDGSVYVSTFRPSGTECSDYYSDTTHYFTVGVLDSNISENVVLSSGTLDTEGETIVIDGNLIVNGGTVNINGGELVVRGDLIQSSGSIDINNGTLIVKGDLRIQTPDAVQDSGYSYSNGYFRMNDANDYVLVYGDFVSDTCKHNYNYEYFSAGVLEVKGNFVQQSTSPDSYAPYSFRATGTHKVILSGSSQQTVNFDDPTASHFAALAITNNSSTGVDVTTECRVDVDLAATDTPVLHPENIFLYSSAIISGGAWDYDLRVGTSWSLQQNQLVRGNLYVEANLYLGAHTLTVEGDLIQSAGSLDINNGTLIVKGDLRIQTPDEIQESGYTFSTGRFYMNDASDYVLVYGDFVVDSNAFNTSSEYFAAGVLEVKGNFVQKSTSTDNYTSYSFRATGTHKVILAGSTLQTVRFENPSSSYSHFNILEITNASEQGVVFSTPYSAVEMLATSRSDLNPMTISVMSWTLETDHEIKGRLDLKDSTLDLAGHTLTIDGNFIHSGGILNVNGGTLIVKGDYLVQTDNEGGSYTYSSGILKMLNAADTIQVDGDFVMDSTKDHDTYLTAGTMTLKGDFTQKSTYVSYYSN